MHVEMHASSQMGQRASPFCVSLSGIKGMWHVVTCTEIYKVVHAHFSALLCQLCGGGHSELQAVRWCTSGTKRALVCTWPCQAMLKQRPASGL